MASGLGQTALEGHVFPAPWAALGLFLLLCGLCMFCKRRKKRIRNVCSTRGPVVDVSLLRQTQLRSLSKSDTKLHEIRRPAVDRSQIRPLSMDPGYPSTMWQQLPCSPPTDATYSQLSYPPNHQHLALYESVELSEDGPPEHAATDEYACVRKIKRCGPPASQEKTPVHPAPAEPSTGGSPQPLRTEAVYSKVHKKKRPEGEGNMQGAPESSQGPIRWGLELLRVPETQPEESLYENICEMNSRVPRTRSKELVTEL
ncbi:lck-interacting transmembrane adapter 1 [Spea bombifrons]|uniref:lck-interacting transmembrane adapter 1 n=1 Tax=Spea bombifrons TaxID=233779 RepID=UPI00234AD115|nr:lck-interacting transmembrane adapter 1 [Spea bombifrons]